MPTTDPEKRRELGRKHYADYVARLRAKGGQAWKDFIAKKTKMKQNARAKLKGTPVESVGSPGRPRAVEVWELLPDVGLEGENFIK